MPFLEIYLIRCAKKEKKKMGPSNAPCCPPLMVKGFRAPFAIQEMQIFHPSTPTYRGDGSLHYFHICGIRKQPMVANSIGFFVGPQKDCCKYKCEKCPTPEKDERRMRSVPKKNRSLFPLLHDLRRLLTFPMVFRNAPFTL